MAEVIINEIYGNCPVQAEGTIDGKEFYFRARYASWRLEVGNVLGEPEWTYSEPYGNDYEAGWMTEDEARGFIEQAAKRYAEKG